MTPLVEVRDLVKHFPVTGGVLLREIARVHAVDGVSLTVNAVDGADFELNIVPHTLAETTLQEYRAGQQVNLEVDLIARYLERLLQGDAAAQPGSSGQITRELLESCGFTGKTK